MYASLAASVSNTELPVQNKWFGINKRTIRAQSPPSTYISRPNLVQLIPLHLYLKHPFAFASHPVLFSSDPTTIHLSSKQRFPSHPIPCRVCSIELELEEGREEERRKEAKKERREGCYCEGERGMEIQMKLCIVIVTIMLSTNRPVAVAVTVASSSYLATNCAQNFIKPI